MTVTVLLSVSLLALVSSARPVSLCEDETEKVLSADDLTNVQSAVQAVLESHTSRSKHAAQCLEKYEDQDVEIRLTTVESQQAHLALLDDSAVKAVIPLEEGNVHSADEMELLELLHRMELESGRRTPVPDEALDAISHIDFLHNEGDTKDTRTTPETSDGVTSSLPIGTSTMVLLASCVSAILLLACVGVSLWVSQVLRSSFRSAWDLLPRLEKQAQSNINCRRDDTSQTGGDTNTLQQCATKVQSIAADGSCTEKATSETAGEQDIIILVTPTDDESDFDVDEKYHDAEPGSLYSTPLIETVGLPESRVASPEPHRSINTPSRDGGDSDLALPLRPFHQTSGLPGSSGSLETLPDKQEQPPEDSSVSTYQHKLPRPSPSSLGIDAALAMQLRPGFGVGAEAAWLVRFVMMFFGWFAAVLVGRRP